MKPQFVPVILGGRRGTTPFTPARLFTTGVAGAWYDPSDYSTLFQDSAGTTPVTAVEQPVGLMLDKSQGLALTPTAIDGNLNTATWTKGTGWSAPSARSLVCDGTQTGSSDTSASYTKPTGALVRWSFTISAISGTLTVYPTGGAPSTFTTTGAKTVCSDAASNFNIFRIGAGQTCTITDIRIEIIAGNHASQATAASRPVLRARYNLLTYSEQFDNAAYTKSSVTLTTNATTAPDGTTTAEKVLATVGNARHAVYPSGVTANGTCVASIYVKYDNHAFFQIGGSSGGFYANFNVQTGVVGTSGGARYISHAITSVGSGWYRLSVTYTNSSDGPWLQLVSSASDGLLPFWTAAGTESTFIWGAQVDNASSIGTYQRIAAATDYATAGFLPYLALDGTDDSFGTNSIDFSATDKMSVCAGVTKLNAAATFGIVAELTANWNTNAGSFYVGVEDTTYRYASGARGNAATSIDQVAKTTDAAYASPSTNVLTTTHDITASQSVLRLNAVAINTATGAKGSGNFSNAPLYIGRRGGASAPLNGRIYQLIVCGKTLSASELASTEAYVNSKTGAY